MEKKQEEGRRKYERNGGSSSVNIAKQKRVKRRGINRVKWGG